ncbi:MAG: hypothetical protein QOE92_1658 [Chloroflexota bacterium]|jgi:hypothetical protein|nr:hypothetical protein [Chloroflexota bacterium]
MAVVRLRPSAVYIRARLQSLALPVLAGIIALGGIELMQWSRLPGELLIAINLAVGVSIAFGIGYLLVYLRNASLSADGAEIWWSTAVGRRQSRPREGLQLRWATVTVPGGKVRRCLLLTWPDLHKMSIVWADLYDRAELDEWVTALGAPIIDDMREIVAMEDLGESYPGVFGKPAISQSRFLALVGAVLVAATAVGIFFFYR